MDAIIRQALASAVPLMNQWKKVSAFGGEGWDELTTSTRAGAQEWENGVASKLRKRSRAGHLAFVFDCTPALIAIAVYRKEDVDLRIKRCLVARQSDFVWLPPTRKASVCVQLRRDL